MPKLKFKPLEADSLGASRAKVPGGWLIYVFQENSVESYAHGGLTFYPDPKHEWDGGSLA